MPKKKCEVRCVKASQKMSPNQPREKFVPGKKQTTFDGVDSLLFLKDTKERKKINDIDGRIMLLKSELKSLMDGVKSDKDCDTQGNNLWNLNKVENRPKELGNSGISDSGNLKDLKECMINKTKEFQPSSSSTPSKFTEWLNNAINETNSLCPSETETLCEINSSYLTSEIQREDSASKRFTQNKVEELLYKSFIMQNDVEILSDMCDTNMTKNTRPKRKINQEKCNKSKETSKKPQTGKLVQGKNKQCRVPKKGRKKRIINLYTSDSDMEVINLDNTMVDNTEPRTDSFIDLDLQNYDWSEPFDVDDYHYESPSDVQVLSESQTNCYVSANGSKSNGTEQKEGNENADKDKPQAKKVWECPVCLEHSKGQEIVATQCGHIFCKNCLESHTLKVKNNCPTCRADLNNKPVITLFNF